MGNSAFTYTYQTIEKKLRTEVTIENSSKSINTFALWDTGASISCISEEVANSLELIPTGEIDMATPSGVATRNTYLINVTLPNDVKINDLVVADSEIGKQGLGMLVGMDIITKGDFAVTHSNGRTKFTFRIPSLLYIDFVRDIKINNVIKKPQSKTKSKNKKHK